MVCDAAAVRSSSASSFNKCFFVTLHDSITKQNPPTQSRMPLKITSPLVPNAGILLISVQDVNKLFKPSTSKQMFFHSFVLMTDSSAGLCQKVNAHLYTGASVDKIAQ